MIPRVWSVLWLSSLLPYSKIFLNPGVLQAERLAKFRVLSSGVVGGCVYRSEGFFKPFEIVRKDRGCFWSQIG